MEWRGERHRTVLFGAFDRFNYGDLLYPWITRWMLGKAGVDCDVRVCAQLASDLGAVGGEPTVRLHDAIQDFTPTAPVTILVAGGEVLSQGWFGTMLASVSEKEAGDLLRIRQHSDEAAAEQHCRATWSHGRRFPWLVGAKDVPGARIAYNSVGGWPLARAAAEDRRATTRILAEAHFLSVRDATSWEILLSLSPDLHPRLAPDAISLLARMWPRDTLRDRGLTPEELAHIGSRYLCVQANTDYVRDNLSLLAAELDQAASYLGAGLVLLPFGHCRGWNDEDGLRVLGDHLRTPSLLLRASRGLRGLTAVLAGASLFTGTSLHGVIAASAYGVPAVPLLTADPKVSNYLATWPIAGASCCPLAALRSRAVEALRQASQQAAVQAVIETSVWENFQEFLASVQLKSPPSWDKMTS